MNTLDALFHWLLAASLRASVLAVVILGLRAVLRAWLPSHWRFALWLPVVLVLMMPVLPVLPWSPLGMLKKGTTPAVPEMTLAPLTGADAAPVVVTPASLPSVPKFTTMNLLAVAWLLGVGAFLAIGAISYRKSLKRMERNAAAPGPELARAISQAAAKVGLTRAPHALMSPEVQSPAVTGLLRPLLLLPADFPGGLSENEARMILLHECTHLKRLDLPVNWLLCLLQAVHWFNPVLWITFARVRADRESACDAQVLALDEADHRSDYGHALLKLQSATPPFGYGLAFVGFFKRGAVLHSRIREISRYRRAHPAWNLAAAGLVGVCTLIGVTRAEPNDKPADAPKNAASAKEAAAGTEIQQAVMKKLNEIILPAVNFEDTTVEEAVEFFRIRGAELDKSDKDSPDAKGVNIMVRTKPGETLLRIEQLQLRNVPLAVALKYVADSTHMRYQVDEAGTVILSSQAPKDGAAEEKAKPEAGSGQAYLQNKLKALVIPAINFEDVALSEAIDYFRQRSKELDTAEKDPAKKGINFVLRAKPDQEAPRIQSLRLRNVPLSVALKYVADATGMTCKVDDHAVVLVPNDESK